MRLTVLIFLKFFKSSIINKAKSMSLVYEDCNENDLETKKIINYYSIYLKLFQSLRQNTGEH